MSILATPPAAVEYSGVDPTVVAAVGMEQDSRTLYTDYQPQSCSQIELICDDMVRRKLRSSY